jgi:nucleoid DNA-binding protein
MNSESIAPEKIKDVLITRTAIKHLQSEAVVEKVINFQFKDACEMMKIHHQIEISGFGKFMISGPKVTKRIKRIEDITSNIKNILATKEDIPEKKKALYEKQMADNEVVIRYLKTRKNGYEN